MLKREAQMRHGYPFLRLVRLGIHRVKKEEGPGSAKAMAKAKAKNKGKTIDTRPLTGGYLAITGGLSL